MINSIIEIDLLFAFDVKSKTSNDCRFESSNKWSQSEWWRSGGVNCSIFRSRFYTKRLKVAAKQHIIIFVSWRGDWKLPVSQGINCSQFIHEFCRRLIDPTEFIHPSFHPSIYPSAQQHHSMSIVAPSTTNNQHFKTKKELRLYWIVRVKWSIFNVLNDIRIRVRH